MHYFTWLPTAFDEYWTLIFYAFPVGTIIALAGEFMIRRKGGGVPGLLLAAVMGCGLVAVGDLSYWSLVHDGFGAALEFFLYGIGYCLLVTAIGFVLLLLINLIARD